MQKILVPHGIYLQSKVRLNYAIDLSKYFKCTIPLFVLKNKG